MKRLHTKYYKILLQVKKKYPYIKNTKVSILLKELKGSARTRWSHLFGYYIIINPIRLEKMNSLAVKGVFAHELAHVHQEVQKNYNIFTKIIQVYLIWKIKERLPHNLVKKDFHEIEYGADLLAIEMGFGKELIELKKFIEKNYSQERLKEMRDTYMSLTEVKKYIKKLGK